MFQILFRNNNNAPNRDLVDFLDNNLTNIVKSKYTIKPMIVNEEKIPELIDSGITELPAMKFNQDICLGVNDIITYIKNLCERTPKKTQDENLDDYVNDFMTKSLEMGDEDPDDAAKNDIKKKTEEFQKKRVGDAPPTNSKLSQPQNKGPTRPSTSSNNANSIDNNTIFNRNKQKPDDMEDRMMSQGNTNNSDTRDEAIELSQSGDSKDDEMMRAMLERMEM